MIADIIMGVDSALGIVNSVFGKDSTPKDRITKQASYELTTMANKLSSEVNAFNKSLQSAYSSVNGMKEQDLSNFDKLSASEKEKMMNALTDSEKRKLDEKLNNIESMLNDTLTKYNNYATRINEDYNTSVLPNISSLAEFKYNQEIKKQMQDAMVKIDKAKNIESDKAQKLKDDENNTFNKQINEAERQANDQISQKRSEVEKFHNDKIKQLDQIDKQANTIVKQSADAINKAQSRVDKWDSHSLSFEEANATGVHDGTLFNWVGTWGQRVGSDANKRDETVKNQILGSSTTKVNQNNKDLNDLSTSVNNVAGSWFGAKK